MPETILAESCADYACRPSEEGRRRLLSRRGEPLFLAGWRDVSMIHFEVDGEALQPDVPFPLDLWRGRAFVSLVHFEMTEMRPRLGGEVGRWLFRRIATHRFLNFRTYVRCGDEPGIHFLAEWLSNRLATLLGPRLFSLPYRHARFESGADRARIAELRTGYTFQYNAASIADSAPTPCEAGTIDEWLMERYTAYNSAGGRRRFFRVWHPPWSWREQCVEIEEASLLAIEWPWFREAELVGASHSEGFEEVWMGRPHQACF